MADGDRAGPREPRERLGRPAAPVGAAPAATILAVGARVGAAPTARISSSTPNDRQEPPCVR
mgnify:CR=1 FL=1